MWIPQSMKQCPSAENKALNLLSVNVSVHVFANVSSSLSLTSFCVRVWVRAWRQPTIWGKTGS